MVATAAVFAFAAAITGPAVTHGDAATATFAERFAVAMPSPDCSAKSWPYLAANCLRTADGSRAAPARIITVDR